MKNIIKISAVALFLSSAVIFQSCKDQEGNFNIFSVQDDINFGKQVSEELEKDPKTIILDSAQNKAAYKYIYNLRDSLLSSGKFLYKDVFPWRIRIIKDTILNAFCTPGGFIYVYSGLIKYLDSGHHLAGVMGHEMAHADHRHSTDALTRQYGLQVLFDIVFGKDKGQLVRIAAGIKELQNSRKAETEADESSVKYLYPTTTECRGAAGFFEKLIAAGASNPPEFFSTHPNPDNRVANIHKVATELGGKRGKTYTTEFKAFKLLIP